MSERKILIDEILKVTGLSRGRIDQLMKQGKFYGEWRKVSEKRKTPVIDESELVRFMNDWIKDKQRLIDEMKLEKSKIEKRFFEFNQENGLL